MASYQMAQGIPQTENVPHKIVLDERRKLTVSGVTEVISFDSDTVLLKTVKGVLHITGEGLKLRALTPDAGRIEVDGQIDALTYTQLREGGFFRRLFG